MKSVTIILLVALLASCRNDEPPAEAANVTAAANATAPDQAATGAAAPESAANAQGDAVPPRDPAEPVSACLTQDGAQLPPNRLRAIGTEPFWGARIEGRCVTYSTPEDQDGTRIWTRFESGPNGGVWNGALRGKRFQLYIEPSPDCSDGMSDQRYPMKARLLVP